MLLLASSLGAARTEHKSSSAEPTRVQIYRRWAVSAENDPANGLHVVFMVIGAEQTPKLPILVLSYHHKTWTALLTCGESLESSRTAPLLLQWDGRETQLATWRRTSNNSVAFAREPLSFIQRLLACHNLAVDFPTAGAPRSALFNVAGLEREIDAFPEAKKALVPKARSLAADK